MQIEFIYQTRMHSSRIRTGRSLTVCCSPAFRGGGGGVWSGGVSAPRGGCLVMGGSAPGGGGLGVPGRGWVSQHALRQTPLPPVDRHTPVKILPWPNFVAAGNNIIRGVS